MVYKIFNLKKSLFSQSVFLIKSMIKKWVVKLILVITFFALWTQKFEFD